MIPIAAIQLPAMRTATRDHAVAARSMVAALTNAVTTPPTVATPKTKRCTAVSAHGAPVLVAVAEAEHSAERDQHGQRQAPARRQQQAEHDERGCIQEAHGWEP